MAFTKEQQKEIDRLNASRIRDESDEDSPGISLSKLEKRTPVELRARVNILGISDSVNFSAENDYTDQEKAVIEAAQPTKWMIEIPKLLEDAQTLRDEGMSEYAIAVVLKNK
jgi:hypothetical protein